MDKTLSIAKDMRQTRTDGMRWLRVELSAADHARIRGTAAALNTTISKLAAAILADAVQPASRAKLVRQDRRASL